MDKAGVKLEWDDRFSVGIPEVDADHRRLIELANKLNAAFLANARKSEIEEILTSLANEAEAHFRREEKLFLASANANIAQHASIHADIIAQLARLSAEFEVGKYRAIWLAKAALVKRLLLTHLLEDDRELSSAKKSARKEPCR